MVAASSWYEDSSSRLPWTNRIPSDSCRQTSSRNGVRAYSRTASWTRDAKSSSAHSRRANPTSPNPGGNRPRFARSYTAGMSFFRARSPVTPNITSTQGPAMRGSRRSCGSRSGFPLNLSSTTVVLSFHYQAQPNDCSPTRRNGWSGEPIPRPRVAGALRHVSPAHKPRIQGGRGEHQSEVCVRPVEQPHRPSARVIRSGAGPVDQHHRLPDEPDSARPGDQRVQPAGVRYRPQHEAGRDGEDGIDEDPRGDGRSAGHDRQHRHPASLVVLAVAPGEGPGVRRGPEEDDHEQDHRGPCDGPGDCRPADERREAARDTAPDDVLGRLAFEPQRVDEHVQGCLLYTSDAADEEDSVDLGGRR